jgi:hypothetical protein
MVARGVSLIHTHLFQFGLDATDQLDFALAAVDPLFEVADQKVATGGRVEQVIAHIGRHIAGDLHQEPGLGLAEAAGGGLVAEVDALCGFSAAASGRLLGTAAKDFEEDIHDGGQRDDGGAEGQERPEVGRGLEAQVIARRAQHGMGREG